MKSIDVKKIGSVVAGTAMLGAALVAPVSAAADMTGVDKGFFYDADFNPIVQIVVGEKGMATDAVAAGNIAATIGNLAYMTQTETFSPSYEPQGQVVIETAAVGATGDYLQDTNPSEADNVTLTQNFFDKDVGFYFDSETKTYERGDFTQYALACEQQTRSEAGILLEGTYNNIHCLFCKTLCVEGLKNPSHDMKEKIIVDNSKIRYYEEGLGDDDSEALKMALEKEAIKYVVETGYIPLEDMDVSTTSTEKYADFEYRGKIIFMGNEYYVKDIDSDKLYLAEGRVLDDITSEGYTSEFKGYKFKIDHLIYSGEYEVAGILLDVEKPDGTVVQVQISKMANGVVDDLEVAGVYAEAAGAVETASLIVYDTSSQVVLEDGEDLELGGVEYDGWKVNWVDYKDSCNSTSNTWADWDCDISEYDTEDANAFDVLGKIEVVLNEDLDGVDALEEDESLNFPSQFMLTFKGFMTGNYRDAQCSGDGEGNIIVERGNENYDLLVSFTGDDGNRYDNVILSEGPFSKGDAFMFTNSVWEFEKYSKEAGSTDAADTVDVTRKPLITGSKTKITLVRYCDPDDGATTTSSTPGELRGNCSDYETVSFREISLLDAMDDDDSTEYSKDNDFDVDGEDLYWEADPTFGVIYFDESSNQIFYADDVNDDDLTINPSMIGTFDDFDVDNTLTLKVVRETGFSTDVNSTVDNRSLDLNGDAGALSYNDDDLLVVFHANDESSDEDVVIDFSDRSYDETYSQDYNNRITYYNGFGATQVGNNATEILTLDEDEDTVLITPFSGDTYTVDWGVDSKIDAVELCHPTKDVDVTYFLGIGEETTYVEDTVTKDDEGTEVTAGCCTFKVKEFSVDVAGADEQSYTSSTVNTIVGRMVVSEVGADTTKNLVIVGGPAVNGMCTVTADEISAEADKFVVKKDGNLLIVAGYEYQETLSAGDALVEWLNSNVHA